MPYSYNKHRHHEQPDQYPANETQIRYSNLDKFVMLSSLSNVVNCRSLKIVLCSNSSMLQSYSTVEVTIWQHLVLNSVLQNYSDLFNFWYSSYLTTLNYHPMLSIADRKKIAVCSNFVKLQCCNAIRVAIWQTSC